MCRVLLIEDEPLIARLLTEALQEFGASSVSVARSAVEAVDEAVLARPDLISADLHLLEGTGLSAVKVIWSWLGAIPTIFVTSSPEPCQSLVGPTRVLQKPIRVEQYRSAYNDLLSATSAVAGTA